MKVLITGVSGTGKSTIAKALRSRGVKAIDFSDVPGLCFWQDEATGEKVAYEPTEDPAWLKSHDRFCDKEMLQEVLCEYDDIVVAGISRGSQMAYLDLFDKVILLQCTPEEILRRVVTRENPYGRTKAERDMVLEWQKDLDPKLISYGAIPISTDGDLDAVLDKIVVEL